MLVRFDSKAGSITMFGDVAKKLLRLMGQSGAIPGAILAADIAPAVERLRNGIAGQADPPEKRRDDGEPAVNLHQRAFPLIQLLERAQKKGADVIWEEERRVAI